MEKEKKSFLSAVWNNFVKNILAGIATVIPLVITILMLKSVFNLVDGVLSPIVYKLLDKKIPGLGFILMLVLLYLLGLFSTNFLGKKFWKFVENLFMKMPIIRGIYNIGKQVVDAFSDPQKHPFQKFVLVNCLGSRRTTIAFVTGYSFDKNGVKYIHVYLPTPPNPVTGFLELVRENQIFETKLTFEDAVKFALSGGVVTPERLN